MLSKIFNTVISVLLVLSALSLIGCNEGDETNANGDYDGNEKSEDSQPDENACSSGIITTGFGFSWQNVNHRISWLKLAPTSTTCESDDNEKTLTAGFIGGDWSTGDMMTDIPTVQYNYEDLSDSDVIGLYSGSVELTINAPQNVAESIVSVTLEEAKLSGFDDYVVLVNGLELNTNTPQSDQYPSSYQPEMGYTSRGLGAWCSIPEISNGELNFTVGLRFDHGPSDRPNMNEAIPFARTVGVLHYLVVAVEDGQIDSFSHQYEMTYDKPEVMVDQQLEHAERSDRTVQVTLSDGLTQILLGWRKFNMELDPDGTADEQGDEPIGYYMRELSVNLDLLSYDEQTGDAEIDIDGYASNSTGFIAYYPMIHRFSAEVAAIQLPRDISESHQVEKSFQTGETTIELKGDE